MDKPLQDTVSSPPLPPSPPSKSRITSPMLLVIGVIVLLGVGGIGGYVVKSSQQPESKPGTVVASVTPKVTVTETVSATATPAGPISCEERFGNDIRIEKSADGILLTDTVNAFSLELSSLRDIAFSEGSGCERTRYELDMYALRPVDQGSIARIVVFKPMPIAQTETLVMVAKKEFNYSEGKHEVKPEEYGMPYTSTALEEQTLPEGMKMVTWKNIYTDQPTHQEGLTASKNYLIQRGTMVYSFILTSWDMPAFDKAVSDFDLVIKSFKSPLK